MLFHCHCNVTCNTLRNLTVLYRHSTVLSSPHSTSLYLGGCFIDLWPALFNILMGLPSNYQHRKKIYWLTVNFATYLSKSWPNGDHLRNKCEMSFIWHMVLLRIPTYLQSSQKLVHIYTYILMYTHIYHKALHFGFLAAYKLLYFYCNSDKACKQKMTKSDEISNIWYYGSVLSCI